MHEMSLTRNVLDIVLDEANAAGATRVQAVRVTIGDLRDIVEELFEGLFSHLARGTIAEGAELEIVRVPFIVRCRKCSRTYHLDVRDKDTFACPSCGLLDYELNSGMEFLVSGIDILKGQSDSL